MVAVRSYSFNSAARGTRATQKTGTRRGGARPSRKLVLGVARSCGEGRPQPDSHPSAWRRSTAARGALPDRAAGVPLRRGAPVRRPRAAASRARRPLGLAQGDVVEHRQPDARGCSSTSRKPLVVISPTLDCNFCSRIALVQRPSLSGQISAIGSGAAAGARARQCRRGSRGRSRRASTAVSLRRTRWARARQCG